MAVTNMTQLEPVRVTVGIDTHRDAHVAVALDQNGRRLGVLEFSANPAGYRTLEAWAARQGQLEQFGIEGTNSYGAGVARYLLRHDHVVVEVIRPNRQQRRRKGKSDPADAEAAARATLAGEAAGPAKAGSDAAEMLRVLRVARATANKSRTAALNAMRALIVTSPDRLRVELNALSIPRLVAICASLRPRPGAVSVETTTKVALRSLARRVADLDAELADLDVRVDELTAHTAPRLRAAFGVGPEVACVLVATAGDNPERLHSEAAFAKLTGTAPIDCSSGLHQRHRLSRAGDRQANAAIHRILLVRMRWHQPTRDYIARRVSEGKTKQEAMRCLKRYIAREVYELITADLCQQTTQLIAPAA